MNIKYICAMLSATALLSCSSEALEDAKLSSELLNVEKELELTAVETEKTVAVSADCHWEVSVDKQSWSDLTVQPLSGNGSGTITLKTSSNTSVSERTALLTITSAAGLRQKVTVRQTLGGATLTVSKAELAFDAVPAASQSFTVMSNTTWRILGIDGDWLTVEPTTGGNGTTEVRVTAAEVQDDRSRDMTLTVALDNGTEHHDIVVTQAGKTNISLALTPEALEVFEATGGQQAVSVASNVRWFADMAYMDDPWVALSTAEGVGNGELTVSCQPNYTTEPRGPVRVNVTTATQNTLVASFAISQKGATLPVISVPLAVSDNTLSKSGASLTFGYTSMFPLTDHGLCYSTTNTMPTLADTRLSLGAGTTADAAVVATIDGLAPLTTCYVRAYVVSPVNDGAVVYSDVASVITLSDVPSWGDNPQPEMGRRK